MRIYPRQGVWEERLMPKIFFRGRDCALSRVRILLVEWRRGGSGEGADEKNKPPALIFGQSFLERGHGLSAFADLVEDFAVSDSVHVPGVGEVGGSQRGHCGFGAIVFAVFGVALGALIHLNPLGSLRRRFRGRERVLEILNLLRYRRRLV